MYGFFSLLVCQLLILSSVDISKCQLEVCIYIASIEKRPTMPCSECKSATNFRIPLAMDPYSTRLTHPVTPEAAQIHYPLLRSTPTAHAQQNDYQWFALVDELR